MTSYVISTGIERLTHRLIEAASADDTLGKFGFQYTDGNRYIALHPDEFDIHEATPAEIAAFKKKRKSKKASPDQLSLTGMPERVKKQRTAKQSMKEIGS